MLAGFLDVVGVFLVLCEWWLPDRRSQMAGGMIGSGRDVFVEQGPRCRTSYNGGDF